VEALGLEDELQAKLDVAVVGNGVGDISKGAGICRIKGGDLPVRVVQLRAVESIEELGSKLQLQSLVYGKAVEQGKVRVEISRTDQLVSAAVSEREGRRLRVGGEVNAVGEMRSVRLRTCSPQIFTSQSSRASCRWRRSRGAGEFSQRLSVGCDPRGAPSG
jgi:hypothetical protein